MNEGVNTTNTESNLEEERKKAILQIGHYLENTAKMGNNDSEFSRFREILETVNTTQDVNVIKKCVEEAFFIPKNKIER